jgi:hypothetical protein
MFIPSTLYYIVFLACCWFMLCYAMLCMLCMHKS